MPLMELVWGRKISKYFSLAKKGEKVYDYYDARTEHYALQYTD